MTASENPTTNDKQRKKATRTAPLESLVQHRVFCDTWTESERGWGCRPDGASLHLTVKDYHAYVKEYWDGMPASAPAEYSRPDENFAWVYVDNKLYGDIQKSRLGVRLWQGEYSKLMEQQKEAPAQTCG